MYTGMYACVNMRELLVSKRGNTIQYNVSAYGYDMRTVVVSSGCRRFVCVH